MTGSAKISPGFVAEKLAREKAAERLDGMLCSYARYRGVPRNSETMQQIEVALVTLLDAKADQKYRGHFIAAMAAAMAELAAFELALEVPRGSKEYEAEMNSAQEQAINNSAKWLVQYYFWPSFFWKKWEKIHLEKAKKLLHFMDKDLFPEPNISPVTQ
jgi:hypothetical protein